MGKRGTPPCKFTIDTNLVAMKKLILKLKKALTQNREDLQYLLWVGVPSGILMVILSFVITFKETY